MYDDLLDILFYLWNIDHVSIMFVAFWRSYLCCEGAARIRYSWWKRTKKQAIEYEYKTLYPNPKPSKSSRKP